MKPQTFLELIDYRRRVAEIYRQARSPEIPLLQRWQTYREARENLLREHSQSPLSPEQRAAFQGLDYFPYDPSLRLALPIDYDVDPEIFQVELEEGLLRFQRFGVIRFHVGGHRCQLSLFWIQGYGGGVFLPFRDQSNDSTTFGGGRYLLDTLKHADLGREKGLLVVDFNFAYNPSCAYHPHWVCPLAPQENWLLVEITGGEMRFQEKE